MQTAQEESHIGGGIGLDWQSDQTEDIVSDGNRFGLVDNNIVVSRQRLGREPADHRAGWPGQADSSARAVPVRQQDQVDLEERLAAQHSDARAEGQSAGRRESGRYAKYAKTEKTV